MTDPKAIARAADVTDAYARMIIAGKRRPSLTVALRIYDQLGVQYGPLEKLDSEGINIARQMVA